MSQVRASEPTSDNLENGSATEANSGEEVPPPTQQSPATRVDQKLADLHPQHSALLAASLEGSQPVWLELTEGRRMLALWQTQQAPRAKGAVIVLPAPGNTALRGPLLANLQESFAELGWSSLILAAPELDAPPKPARPAPANSTDAAAEGQADGVEPVVDETQVVFTEPSQAQAPEPQAPASDDGLTAPERYLAFSSGAIDKAVEFLQSEGQYNLALVGVGSNCRTVLAYNDQIGQKGATRIAKDKQQAVVDQALRAVILIEPDPQFKEAETLLTNPGVAMLDLFEKDRGLASAGAKRRILAARRQEYEVYHQKGLPRGTLAARPEHIARLIRGFLDRHVAGVEM